MSSEDIKENIVQFLQYIYSKRRRDEDDSVYNNNLKSNKRLKNDDISMSQNDSDTDATDTTQMEGTKLDTAVDPKLHYRECFRFVKDKRHFIYNTHEKLESFINGETTTRPKFTTLTNEPICNKNNDLSQAFNFSKSLIECKGDLDMNLIDHFRHEVNLTTIHHSIKPVNQAELVVMLRKLLEDYLSQKFESQEETKLESIRFANLFFHKASCNLVKMVDLYEIPTSKLVHILVVCRLDFWLEPMQGKLGVKTKNRYRSSWLRLSTMEEYHDLFQKPIHEFIVQVKKSTVVGLLRKLKLNCTSNQKQVFSSFVNFFDRALN